MVADVNLLVVQKHTVDSLNGGLGRLSSLVVDETVALGAAVLIGGDLAGQDITECGKGVVEGLDHGSICVKSLLWGSETSLSDLVVDLLVEVLDENVALTGLAEGGVTLRPHDTAAER